MTCHSNDAAVITVFSKNGGPLTKRISLAASGGIVADGAVCVMTSGRARIAETPTSEALAAALALAARLSPLAMAETACRRWRDEGRAVRVVKAINSGKDFNDLMAARAAGGGR